MSIFLPSKQTKKYSVSTHGDVFGNLVATRNLDFQKKGYVSLARKPITFFTETQNADFETPLAILSDDDYLYVITTEDMFAIDASAASLSATKRDAGTPPSFGFQSDAVFFGGVLHASGTSMICSHAAASWTSRITGLSTSYPHPLFVSEHQQYLAVGNGNTVALYSSAYGAAVTTLTIPAEHVVTWIRWRANLLYIGTRNILGGEARVYIWNGSGTAAQSAYGVGADWAFSGCEYRSTICIVNSIGQLLYLAGNGFVPLRSNDGTALNFPVYHSDIPWGSSAATSNLIGKVTSRGMQAKGDRLYIVINNRIEYAVGGTQQDILDMPSGLWVVDPEIGLYHKAGCDHAQRVRLQVSSVASDVLALPSAQVFETGDPVVMSSVSGLTGDIDTLIYYAIKVDSTHLKLANTPQQALAGVGITITGEPGANDLIDFNIYESVGATRIRNAGPVHVLSAFGMPRFNGSEVVYGADVENAAGATIGAVMSLGMGKNVGSLTSPKIQAEAVTDIFKKMIAKFPPINIASRKILVKYRLENRWGLPGRRDFDGGKATWATSTTFTVNPKIYDMYAVAVGDEVEFTSSAGAGYTAHITLITVNSATQWTITIDETMPDVTAGEVADFVINNWTKYKTISTSDIKAAAQGLKNMALTKKAKWIQIKIELRGYTDIEETMDIEELMLLNAPDQKYA